VEKPITQEVIQRVEELAKLKIANGDVMKEMRSEIEACYSKYKDESSEENAQKNTIDDVRVIVATSLTQILTWIDASFAVHSDMKSHTGGCTSMGIGLVHQK